MNTADWLRSALNESGRSGASLARMVQAEIRRPFHRTYVSKILSGERRVQPDELVAISKILKTPPPTQLAILEPKEVNHSKLEIIIEELVKFLAPQNPSVIPELTKASIALLDASPAAIPELNLTAEEALRMVARNRLYETLSAWRSRQAPPGDQGEKKTPQQ